MAESSDTNEIYVEAIPEKYIGKTYQELRRDICNTDTTDIILIGLSTFRERKTVSGEPILNYSGEVVYDKALIINPKIPTGFSDNEISREYILQKKDKIFLIAYTRPDLNQII